MFSTKMSDFACNTDVIGLIRVMETLARLLITSASYNSTACKCIKLDLEDYSPDEKV